MSDQLERFKCERLKQIAQDSSVLAAMAKAAGLSAEQCAAVARKELNTIDSLGRGADYQALRLFFNALIKLEENPGAC